MNKLDIEDLLSKHREKAFITCDETCFCWDVEKLLREDYKEVVVPKNITIRCSLCGGMNGYHYESCVY